MSDTTQTNAMAEIALALAMGFFSIMVLTLVSMGGGMISQTATASFKDDPIAVAKTTPETEPQSKGASQAQVEPQDLVIFHDGRFLNHVLQPVDPAMLNERDKVVLAVSPDLSMARTIQARQQVQHRDITVVVLNDKWLNALQEAGL